MEAATRICNAPTGAGFSDMVNGPMQTTNYTTFTSASYTLLSGNGLGVTDPGDWRRAELLDRGRRSFIKRPIGHRERAVQDLEQRRDQLHDETTLRCYWEVKQPVEVASIRVNGATTNAVIWTSVTNWSISLTLTNGGNTLNAQGYDRLSNVLTNCVRQHYYHESTVARYMKTSRLAEYLLIFSVILLASLEDIEAQIQLDIVCTTNGHGEAVNSWRFHRITCCWRLALRTTALNFGRSQIVP